ncbi:MAG TPA: Ig-like domain-containing protein [Caulobacteraceae bacterium]|nr:Ig-like domain-containing protein [Caulobacteraceae bacterium]
MVVPGPGPTVKSTYPNAAGSVPAGTVILKIVFDQPMTPDAWAYGRSADGDFPDCLAEPRLLNDQRTFVLLCSVALPNRTYAVEINLAPRFASAYGRSAKPYTLKFSTNDAITRGLHDALLQAGLDDTDDPIMTWRDPGQGVSQTAPPP